MHRIADTAAMRTLLCMAVAAGCLTGCASSGPPAPPSYISSGSLPGAVSGARTIGLAVGSGVENDVRIDASGVENAVREAIIDELSRRGYALAPPPRADRLIAYIGIVDYGDEDAILFQRLGMSPGVGRGEHVERGTIGLFIFRQNGVEPVWRGAAQGVLDPRASDRVRAERVNVAVQTLLADLPPAR